MPFSSKNPATGEPVWTGEETAPDELDRAIRGAREGFRRWSATALDERIAKLKTFAGVWRR
jgi:succinylglutamic semialdehyde dehydrogenase